MRRQYFDYRPRPQFRAFHRRKERFACIITHRRAGKTVACIHELQRRAIESTKKHPRFAYLSPLLKQSKTVAWDYLRDAMSLLRKAGATVNETELRADYPNGGQVRLYGADNPDALRGFYLDGVVLDEYADMDPRVWPEIIRPCLSDREGWAVFIGTTRGRTYSRSEKSRRKAGSELKASESGLLPQDELAMARADLPEDKYAQEFECSFDAAIAGSYYGKLMAQAESERRVACVPHDPAVLVWTDGIKVFGMPPRSGLHRSSVARIHIIDYYEASGVDLAHYVRHLARLPYIYAGHIVPHDARARELGTGKSRIEVMEGLGLKN